MIETDGVVDMAEGKWTCDDGIESMDSKVTVDVEDVYKTRSQEKGKGR